MIPPPIFSEHRHGELYLKLLYNSDERLRLYVYRWDGRRRIKPAIYKGRPIQKLEEYLQDKYDGGEFHVMIRRGETMLVSGLLLICPLPSRREAFEAFKVTYGW